MTRKVLGACGALVILALAVALVPQRGKASDIDNVLVVNGPKKPVPVTLTGPPGSSLPVHDVDNPARMPFQNTFLMQIKAGATVEDEQFALDIPAHTRFAITQVVVRGVMPVGQKLIEVFV